jgi:hypothetical protein
MDLNDVFSTRLSFSHTHSFPCDTDCEFPDTAFSYWRKDLTDYETGYWEFPDHSKNFAFFYNDIIYGGINLVSGTVHDELEWAERQAENLEWIEDTYNAYSSEARVMVVFAHAAPLLFRLKNAAFYE